MKYINTIDIDNNTYTYYDINKIASKEKLEKIPYTIRILLEGALRNFDNYRVTEKDLDSLINWEQYQKSNSSKEIPFIPSRIILQDFTGVPAVVDLAAMRAECKRAGKNPEIINPNCKVDLIIDHSLMVDDFGSKGSFFKNIDMEFIRNKERYEFLKWAMNSFDNFRVHPPAEGIIHQINLEQLASLVMEKENESSPNLLYPDTLVGTDSHSTMINGLGVLGFGVGGIEAEAAMLGQAIYIPLPKVIGVNLIGETRDGITSTDISLHITKILRQHNVVGKFIEYFGEGAYNMSLTNRATISNMAPEYGATMGYFPVDYESLDYLRLSARKDELIDKVESYYKANSLFREESSPIPNYSEIIEIDLGQIKPAIAGPKRPQDLLYLDEVKSDFISNFGNDENINSIENDDKQLKDGDIVLAAITSCTNTSNPHGMMAAGLIAKKAVENGLSVNKMIKTSLTPGSKTVSKYLKNSGLLNYLEDLGFHVAGYACATCIGNSGKLTEGVSDTIQKNSLSVASILSGNRNFEGRIHADIKANYLASPMLVVAYALKGSVLCDIEKESLGKNKDGKDVYLKDILPSNIEINEYVNKFVKTELFANKEENKLDKWQNIEAKNSPTYDWKEDSSYIREAEFFMGILDELEDNSNGKSIKNARVLAYLGDSITTDHISPAGEIKEDSPAGIYLKKMGINKSDFNSYGSRRGNHEVMVRGTFANTRIKNKLLNNIEGGYSKVIGNEKIMSIFDVAMEYKKTNTDVIILAGKEYGTGSSRDWAAKGVFLQGVKAVIAESFERIHRSNLIGMGVLPLQFKDGESAESLKLTGFELYDFEGIENIQSGQIIKVKAKDDSGGIKEFELIARLDNKVEVDYYMNGGILNKVLRDLIRK